MSLFCPQCGGLLYHRKVEGTLKPYCKRCGTRSTISSTVQAQTQVQNAHRRGPAPADPDNPLFIHGRPRDGQREFMEDVRSAIASGTHLVAHAPTGIGKTSAALAPALEACLKDGRLLVFLTSKRSQHRIVMDFLKTVESQRGAQVRALKGSRGRHLQVVDIIAKQAMCPREESRWPHAAFIEFCQQVSQPGGCRFFNRRSKELERIVKTSILSFEELKRVCVGKGVCPHRMAMDAVKNADVLVCDYNYMFSDFRETVMERMDRDLNEIVLVVDEAHNLPDRIRDHLSGDVTSSSLSAAIDEIRGRDPLLERRLLDLARRIGSFLGEIPPKKEKIVTPQRLDAMIDDVLGSGLDQDTDRKRFLDALSKTARPKDDEPLPSLMSLVKFLEDWSRPNEGTLRYGRGGDNPVLSLRLMDPSVISAEIFRQVHSATLMSGTLYPPEMYRDLLGMDDQVTKLATYSSPFPPENRKVVCMKGITTAYRSRGEDMYRKIASEIASLARNVPGNMAAFFPSYFIAQEVSRYIPGDVGGKQVFLEERQMGHGDRERLFDRLENARGKGILWGVQGGSMSEGLDYPDNLLQSVVVVGIPMAPPSLEVDFLRQYYETKFGSGRGEQYGYIFPAMNRVAQASGRAVRSETDRALIVLMDERFVQVRYNRYLPPDLSPTESVDLSKEADGFFNDRSTQGIRRDR